MNVARISIATLVTGLVACGEVVPQNQVAAGDPAPPALPTDAGAADGGPTTPPKRTVETRNPYGNLDPQNLVLDGDFEFSGRQGQMPWLSFNGGQGTLDYETGGLCFSGTRCGKLVKGASVFGWMVSPKAGTRVEVSLKVRAVPGTPSADAGVPCPEPAINVFVINIDDQDQIERIDIEPNTMPVNGFCTYRTVVDAIPNGSPGVYVESEAAGTILMDQVVAKPVGPNTALSHRLPARAVTAASKAKVTAVIDWIRKHRQNAGEHAPQPLK